MKSLISAFLIPLLLASFLSSVSFEAVAETVYIRDVIYVPLRGGQSNEYRILNKGIPSGTVLERKEVNEETGFSRVVTPGGQEGWIQSQYLVTEPIARDQLRNLRAQFSDLQKEYETTEQTLESKFQTAIDATNTIGALETERQVLSDELARITALAADVIEIDQQNDSLQSEISALNQQIDDLVVVNADLQDTANQTWYMIGAGTIFLGLILGFWVGRQLYTSRSSDWS